MVTFLDNQETVKKVVAKGKIPEKDFELIKEDLISATKAEEKPSITKEPNINAKNKSRINLESYLSFYYGNWPSLDNHIKFSL